MKKHEKLFVLILILLFNNNFLCAQIDTVQQLGPFEDEVDSILRANYMVNGEPIEPYKHIELQISPLKKIITINDSALFLLKFINYSDSLYAFKKHPMYIFSYNNELRNNMFIFMEMYIDLLREKNSGYVKEYRPYCGDGYSIPKKFWDNDSIGMAYLRESNIIDSLNNLKIIELPPKDTIQYFLDLFPNKEDLCEGKHKVRISIKIPFENSFFIVQSNWSEFIFYETSNGLYPCD